MRIYSKVHRSSSWLAFRIRIFAVDLYSKVRRSSSLLALKICIFATDQYENSLLKQMAGTQNSHFRCESIVTFFVQAVGWYSKLVYSL